MKIKDLLSDHNAIEILSLLGAIARPQTIYNNCIFKEPAAAPEIVISTEQQEPRPQPDEKDIYREYQSKNKNNPVITFEEMVVYVTNRTGLQREWVEIIINELSNFYSLKGSSGSNNPNEDAK